MKILITILQCRRVALPFLFIRHALPMMKAVSGSSVCVHLVQHEYLLEDANPHETSTLPPSKQQLVTEWTKEGRYAGAIITRHSEQFPQYPSIPSRRIAAEFAAKHGPDVHLWLEDDAFVYDEDCGTWSETLGTHLVGAYRENAFGYINAAHYVCRPEIDRQLLLLLRDPDKWNLCASMYIIQNGQKTLNLSSPRIEPTLTRIAAKRIAQLRPTAASRHNARKPESVVALKTLLKRVCPADLHWLALDFPGDLWC
jgi:hypothetical protein